jgi:beta-galactosidase
MKLVCLFMHQSFVARLRRLGISIALLGIGFVHAASATARIERSLDANWRFSLGDPIGAQAAVLDDTGWRSLNVPHDWSIEGEYNAANATGAYGAYLPSGIGWYRREIEMPDAWQGRTVTVVFEGVYMGSDVWLNGERVGGRPYGYSSFICDLTAHLRPGRNVLAVRVDNLREPSARWYHGSGIYGHVRLTATDPVYVPTWGVFVQTPTIDADAAVVRVGVELKNDSQSEVEVEVQMDVISPDGSSTGSASEKATVAADSAGNVQQNINVKQPMLWSIESPTLYTLKTRVLRAGKVVDEVATSFGIRSIKFDADRGFFLNGQSVKLKGVCEHQGGSPVGAAMPEVLLERRLNQLKEMGCNAIRVAHNPQLPAFYELCDRLGLLVMDEVFDGWHRKAPEDYGARFFAEWWRRDVTDWVRRDRNHPSVILWSIGNETGRKDEYGIADVIRSLDPTRPATGGDVIEGVDVAGFNGRSVPNDAALEQFHREHPTQPLLMSEEPHSFQTRGFYRTVSSVYKAIDNLPDYATLEVFGGGHSAFRSSYDNDGRRLVARNSWKRTLARPWVSGEFRWTGFDYLGEAAWAGNESLARAFNFGVLDLAGFPKDHYYFYQSIWTSKPMVHLLPHWTHPGLEGKMIPVVAYANAEEVELFQDGKSLGRKPRTDLFECVWQVPYRAGELKAVAYRAGKVVAETTQRTAGVPAQLRLTTDNAALKADRNDLALVTLAIIDDRGTLVPDAENRLDFSLLGPARFLGGENGNPVDVTAHGRPWRKAFAGLARAFYAGQDDAADGVEVAALGILGIPYFRDTTTVTVAFERVALRGGLAPNSFDIHYTSDGSEPRPSSARYSGPLNLNSTSMIRAAVFHEGKLIVSSSGMFVKGVRPASSLPLTPREDQGAAEDPSQKKGRRTEP